MSRESGKLLVHLDSADLAMFRFLLEAYDNLAIFTVLERKPALLKLRFAPESQAKVKAALEDIGCSLALGWREWPVKSKMDHG